MESQGIACVNLMVYSSYFSSLTKYHSKNLFRVELIHNFTIRNNKKYLYLSNLVNYITEFDKLCSSSKQHMIALTVTIAL